MKLRIARAVAAQMLAHAEDEHPREACGLLLGTADHVLEAHAARNVAADPARSFEIEPATLLRLHREARGRGLRVIGHYHSHPDGSALPSRRDAARAVADGQVWMIMADLQLTAWVAPGQGDRSGLVQQCFRPVEIEYV